MLTDALVCSVSIFGTVGFRLRGADYNAAAEGQAANRVFDAKVVDCLVFIVIPEVVVRIGTAECNTAKPDTDTRDHHITVGAIFSVGAEGLITATHAKRKVVHLGAVFHAKRDGVPIITIRLLHTRSAGQIAATAGGGVGLITEAKFKPTEAWRHVDGAVRSLDE